MCDTLRSCRMKTLNSKDIDAARRVWKASVGTVRIGYDHGGGGHAGGVADVVGLADPDGNRFRIVYHEGGVTEDVDLAAMIALGHATQIGRRILETQRKKRFIDTANKRVAGTGRQFESMYPEISKQMKRRRKKGPKVTGKAKEDDEGEEEDTTPLSELLKQKRKTLVRFEVVRIVMQGLNATSCDCGAVAEDDDVEDDVEDDDVEDDVEDDVDDAEKDGSVADPDLAAGPLELAEMRRLGVPIPAID